MRVIFGIGNPGKKYENTRHNAGFMILDRFAEKNNLSFLASKKDYYIAGGVSHSSPFKLVKPTTYVNLCGRAALSIIEEFNISPEDFLVIYDDINLEIGTIRLRKSGGDGGHNGISSLIYHLQTDEFPRLRIGIGNKFKSGEMADYVLSNFSKNELDDLDDCFSFSDSITQEFITGGFKASLNYYSKNSSKLKKNSEQSELND